ncbi:PAS domain-containing protein [Mariniflexile sp.]|uniref:PAS domain-containing protein n=1 Tax=Mariniflexile sp. TaxID=1979402 RepID=UPI0035685B13
MDSKKDFKWRAKSELAISQFINTNLPISVSDSYGRIVYANNHFCKITGYEEQELLGVINSLFSLKRHKDSFYKNLWETIKNGFVWSGVIKNKSKTGEMFSLQTTIIPIKDSKGKIESFVSMYVDVSELNIELT